MPQYFTKKEARAAAQQKSMRLRKSVDAILDEATARVQDSHSFDIFLSHSALDAELVEGVAAILEGRGFTVYVDWIVDKKMDRANVNAATAEMLRKRMRQSKSLVYVATSNASGSKWMPWELGFFDGHKPGHVAILPLLDKPDEKFGGQEYLSIYPLVDKNVYSDTKKEDILVEDHVRKQWSTLERFGKGGATWNRYGS